MSTTLRRALVGLAAPLLVPLAAALSEEPPYGEGVVSLTSAAGQERLRSAVDCGVADAVFANLETQEWSIWCGVATLVTIFNGLGVGPGPVDENKGVEWWTQHNIFEATGTDNVVTPTTGLTLDELTWVASQRVHATAYHAGDHDVAAFRALVQEVYSDCGDRVILSINYDRTAVTLNSSAHHSPLGKYHADSDTILLLDVARYRFPPLWVPLPLLHTAMSTMDSVSGKTRGWVRFNATAAPNLLSTPTSSMSAVLRMLGLVVSGLLAVGCLLGICCARVFCSQKRQSSETERELVEQGA